MKFNHVTLFAILLIAIVFVSGCTQRVTSSYNTPANINTFASADEGEIIRFYFILEDSKGYNTLANGQADLQIKDSTGKAVLTKNFSFESSDFVDYQIKLTGQSIGKAYEWRINKNDIQKGIGTGTAELTLTTTGVNVLKATATYIEIPTYTEEEIKEIYDDNYERTAKTSGKTINKGNFEITLVRYGFYTYLKYGTWGDEVTEFRADLKVENVGYEKDSFSTYDAVIISGSNQYEKSYNSELDTSDIYPGIIKEGYLIFEDVPETLTGQFKIIAGTSYDASYDKLTYEFNVEI